MLLEQRNIIVKKYLDKKACLVNNDYPNLLDDEKLKNAKVFFTNSSDDYEDIIRNIDVMVNKMVEQRKKVLDYRIKIKSLDLNKDEYFILNLNNEKNGLYLSKELIDLLMIVELDSKLKLKEFVDYDFSQAPNKTIYDLLPDMDSLDMESCKRKLFSLYQDSLDSYTSDITMSIEEQIKSKLLKLGIDNQEQDDLIKMIKSKGLNDTLDYLKKTKGNIFIQQFNRLITKDFENIKELEYEEIDLLSSLIINDKSIDTIVVDSGRYNDVVFSDGKSRYFEPFYISKALRYCEKHNLHLRYKGLIDDSYADSLSKDQDICKDKQKIIENIKNFINLSFDFINKNNKILPNGEKIINVIEVFSSLVKEKYNDKEKNYSVIWDEYFDIKISDIIACFNGILKPEGIYFMYSEGNLCDSEFKRKKVEETLYEIESCNAGFIDIIGNQSQISSDDLDNNLINIKETVSLLKRVQEGKLIIDGQEKNIKSKYIELTEFDLHFTLDYINYLKYEINKGIIENEDMIGIKKCMLIEIENIYKSQLKVSRISYRTIFDKIDINLCLENKLIAKKNIESKSNIPLIDSMYAGIFGRNNKRLYSLNPNIQKVKCSNELKKAKSNDIRVKLEDGNKNKLFNYKKVILIVFIIVILLFVLILLNK